MIELDENYPGVGRLHYFLGKMSLIMAIVLVVSSFGPGSSVTRIVGLLVTIASFVLDVMRLRNIGVSQWYAMLRFIPYVNLIYTIGLLSAQPGWAETRQLDSNGKAIAAFLVAMFALLLFMILTRGMLIPAFI